jgi:hypothetical protein
MVGINFLHALACHLAWLEGREDGTNSMCAILHCLKNRMTAGMEGGDLGRILQAEFTKRMLLKQPSIDIPDVRDPSFSQVLGFVEGIFDGTIQDRLTNGAIYYGPKPWGSKDQAAVVGKLQLWF